MSATIKTIGGTPVMGPDGKTPERDATGAIRTTGGQRFVMGLMPAETSFLIQIRLLRIMGESLFKLLILAYDAEAGFSSVLGALRNDPDAMGSVIGMLTQRMEPNDVLSLAKTVFESVYLEGTPGVPQRKLVFAEVFLGKPLLIWQVLIEALKENYGSVLKGVTSPSSESGAAPA